MQFASVTCSTNNIQSAREHRYELTVEGMTCVKCTQKVEKALLQDLEVPVRNLKVDFITNRILASVNNPDDIDEVVQKIESCGFKVPHFKEINAILTGDKRILTIKILRGQKNQVVEALYRGDQPLIDEEPIFDGSKCLITYDPNRVRGSQIMKRLHDIPEFIDGSFLFLIENCFEDDIDKIQFSHFTFLQLAIVLAINLSNVALSFLPEDYTVIPESLGMFSYYFIGVLALTILSLKYVGFSLYRQCIKQLIASFNINMLTLVSMGSGLALIFGFVYTIVGTVQMILGETPHYHMVIMQSCHMFHTSATIFTALVVGKYIEGKIKKRVYLKIDDLKKKLKFKIDSVTRIVPRNKRFDALLKEEVHPQLIEKDDFITISTQCMMPFDGFIEKGTVKVVENIQYGWEKATMKTKGHPIISGSQLIEVHEPVVIRVSEPLEKTVAGRLFREIKEAASGSSSQARSKTDDLLAKITKYFITVVLILAVLTFAGWGLVAISSGNIGYVYPFEKAIAVLVASCPCALGIAIPMMYAIALRKGFKAGVLIKDTGNLDTVLNLDTIVFDKTGTITGTFNIKNTQNISNKLDDASLWEIVSILEKEHLQHPLGLALFQEALQRLTRLDKPRHTIIKNEQNQASQEYYSSEGVIETGVSINGKQVRIALGNKKLMSRLGVFVHQKENNHVTIDFGNQQVDQSAGNKEEENDSSSIYLCIDNEIQFKIQLSLQESIKSNAYQLVSFLKKINKDVQILSGDNRTNACQIGKQLGLPMSNIYADMNLQDKEDHIENLKKQGKRVMMIGDGMNDIKAFKAATVSCSINFKSSQNLTFSDFIIINNDLQAISTLFNLASVTSLFKKIILTAALLYNVPVILAASGLLRSIFGIDLAAYLACWTMVLFSLFLTVIANLMELISVSSAVGAPKFLSIFGAIFARSSAREKSNESKGTELVYNRTIEDENQSGGDLRPYK